jgi:hypothetical protein
VGAGAMVLLWRRSRVLACLATASCLAAALALSRPEARMSVWSLGLQAGLERPLTGWGIGGVQIWPLDHFYSVPLDWFIATGLVGLVAAAWMMAEAWRLADTDTRAILAAWLVQGLFLSAAWPIWLVLFALLADLVGRDVAHRAGVIEDHEPLLNGGVRSLRPE